MPSGASPAIGRPSNSISPSVAGVSPAISSSSVDLPQPDGPTTAKNSPCRMSRSIGPSACTGAGALARHEHLGDAAQPDLGRCHGQPRGAAIISAP